MNSVLERSVQFIAEFATEKVISKVILLHPNNIVLCVLCLLLPF
jgi:hypothetical protein